VNTAPVASVTALDQPAEDRDDPVVAILQRARAREPLALAELIRLHQRSVYSLALRLTGRQEDAEELAQDTFLQMFDTLDNI